MSNLPKYKMIENYILSNIKSGKLRSGDQIETEVELSRKFNIGRLTVNKALKNLADQGYIERTPGKGSFVKPSMVSKSIKTSTSFSEDMRSIGKEPGSKLIEYIIFRASEKPEIAKYLELVESDLIHYFMRLRTGDGEPIALSYTYISAKIVPAINVNALEHSLKEYLNSLGVYASSTIEKMSAHLPTEEQKKYLQTENVALLRNAHITYEQNFLPYEYIETYYIGDKFEYVFYSENYKEFEKK